MSVAPNRRKQCFDRDKNKCVKCGSTDRLTADHVVPKSMGGQDCLRNLQTLCYLCNESKGAAVRQYTNYKGTRAYIQTWREVRKRQAAPDVGKGDEK